MSNETEIRSSALAQSAAPVPIVSPSKLIAVLAGLLVLTGVTIALTSIDMGEALNLWLAIAIAVLQASLIALYFMRVCRDTPFNAVVFVAAMVFVALFIGMAVLDAKESHSDVVAPNGVTAQP